MCCVSSVRQIKFPAAIFVPAFHWFCTTDLTLRLLAKWNSWAKVLDVQACHPDIEYISGNRFYLLFFCAFFLSFLEKGQSEACVCSDIQQTFVGFLNVIVKVWGGRKRKSSLCAPPCDINARSRTIRSVCFSERRFRSKQTVLLKDAPGVFNCEKTWPRQRWSRELVFVSSHWTVLLHFSFQVTRWEWKVWCGYCKRTEQFSNRNLNRISYLWNVAQHQRYVTEATICHQF